MCGLRETTHTMRVVWEECGQWVCGRGRRRRCVSGDGPVSVGGRGAAEGWGVCVCVGGYVCDSQLNRVVTATRHITQASTNLLDGNNALPVTLIVPGYSWLPFDSPSQKRTYVANLYRDQITTYCTSLRTSGWILRARGEKKNRYTEEIYTDIWLNVWRITDRTKNRNYRKG